MSDRVVSVDEQDLGLNTKLKGLKFENVFDTTSIQNAEKLVERNKNNFLTAIVIDFNDLKNAFANLSANSDRAVVEELQNKAFSIKSRAGIGGYPIASDIAKSLFEFCENHVAQMDETKYSIIKVHVNALDEIFSGKFDTKDEQKCTKLVQGLNQLVHKHAK